jgi:hypothetical protein
VWFRETRGHCSRGFLFSVTLSTQDEISDAAQQRYISSFELD